MSTCIFTLVDEQGHSISYAGHSSDYITAAFDDFAERTGRSTTDLVWTFRGHSLDSTSIGKALTCWLFANRTIVGRERTTDEGATKSRRAMLARAKRLAIDAVVVSFRSSLGPGLDYGVHLPNYDRHLTLLAWLIAGLFSAVFVGQIELVLVLGVAISVGLCICTTLNARWWDDPSALVVARCGRKTPPVIKPAKARRRVTPKMPVDRSLARPWPLDVLRLIASHVSTPSFDDLFDISAIDSMVEIDAEAIEIWCVGASRSIDMSAESRRWAQAYESCRNLSLVSRTFHAICIPLLWSRISPAGPFESSTSAIIAQQYFLSTLEKPSAITPPTDKAIVGQLPPRRPLGHEIVELNLTRLKVGGSGSSAPFLTALARRTPNVRSLVLGANVGLDAAGHLWPDLRFIRRGGIGEDPRSSSPQANAAGGGWGMAPTPIGGLAGGASGSSALTILATLPDLISVSLSYGPALSVDFCTALGISQLDRRLRHGPSHGLVELVLTTSLVRSQEVLVALLDACPSLRRFHLAALGSLYEWTTIDLGEIVERTPTALTHFACRAPSVARSSTFDGILDRCPDLRFLSLLASNVTAILIQRMATGTHSLEHLELRVVDPSSLGVTSSSDRGGLIATSHAGVCESSSMILDVLSRTGNEYSATIASLVQGVRRSRQGGWSIDEESHRREIIQLPGSRSMGDEYNGWM